MTKRDLVVKIARETTFATQNEIAEIVQKTLDYISEELIAGNTIELRKFGVLRSKSARAASAAIPISLRTRLPFLSVPW